MRVVDEHGRGGAQSHCRQRGFSRELEFAGQAIDDGDEDNAGQNREQPRRERRPADEIQPDAQQQAINRRVGVGQGNGHLGVGGVIEPGEEQAQPLIPPQSAEVEMIEAEEGCEEEYEEGEGKMAKAHDERKRQAQPANNTRTTNDKI